MKTVIFYILGACLLTAQVKSEFPFELTKTSPHEGIETVLNTVSGQVSSLYKQIQLVILQLSNIAESAIRQMEEDFIKAAINISDLVNDFGETAKNCIRTYWRSLEAAKLELKENIQDCSRNVKEQGEFITRTLKEQQSKIQEGSKKFFELINECLEFKTGKIAECIFYKMNELKDVANEVSGTTDLTLKKAVSETSAISKTGNECVRTALEKFAEVQKEVSSKIRNCVQVGFGQN